MLERAITKKSISISIVIVILAIFLLFTVSLVERLPLIGNLMASGVMLSFESSTFIYNWTEFGIFNVKAKLLKTPICIECPEGERLYSSYPPGFIIIPYLIALVFGNEGTVAFVQGYNLFNHFILACFISLSVLFVYIKSKNINLIWACIMSILAGSTVIFLTGVYYYLMFEYFAEIAALSIVAIIIFIEIIQIDNNTKPHKAISVVQFILIYLACFMDFYCWFVVAVIWLIKVAFSYKSGIKNLIGITLKYVVPAILAVLSFIVYLYYTTGGIEAFTSRYAERTATSLNGEWLQKIKTSSYFLYGGLTLYILVGVCIVFAVLSILSIFFYKKDRFNLKLVGIGIICSLPAGIITVILTQHVFYHDFPLLRFVNMFCILLFALCPVLIIRFLNIFLQNKKKLLIIAFNMLIIISIAVAAVTAGYAYYHRKDYLNIWRVYQFDFEPQKFIYANTDYYDYVYVVPQQLDVAYPPVYARKPTHTVRKNATEMLNVAMKLDPDANICILIVNNPDKPLETIPEYIYEITDSMTLVYSDDDYSFYRNTREEYSEILAKLIE